MLGTHRDRGDASRRRPSHTTVRTGPYTAVRWIIRIVEHEGRQAERDEGDIGEGDRQGGAVTKPPWAVGAASGHSRQPPPDTAAGQFRKPRAAALPLLPGDGAQPPPSPLFKFAQHRGSVSSLYYQRHAVRHPP